MYEEMCKYLTTYEEAVSHMYDFATPFLNLNFLIYEEHLIFFFLSVRYPQGLMFAAGFYEIQRALVNL
jgi:hypothetical protein